VLAVAWAVVTKKIKNINYFRSHFCNSSFAVTSQLFCKIFANTKVPNLFQVKFEYENKIVLSFAKQDYPEIKSFCIALLSCFQITRLFQTIWVDKYISTQHWKHLLAGVI